MKIIPDFNEGPNIIRTMWDRLHNKPGGRSIFSRMVGLAAPYSGTVGAHVEQLREGYCRTTLKDRRSVRNHIQCIHAIALANLAELTGNAALAYSMPDDARFIVAGLSIRYLKKARGTINGICECPIPQSNDRTNYEIHVSLRDKSGEEVAHATLDTLVGPKPA